MPSHEPEPLDQQLGQVAIPYPCFPAFQIQRPGKVADRSMTITAMRRLLDERGLQLTRSLGQNFLHDGNQLRRIAAAAELRPGDRVLEIGPGLGPLTELLVASGCPVTAIEMDRRLVEILAGRFGVQAVPALPDLPAEPTGSRLTLLHADALGWLRQHPRGWADWKLVANLPYSVGSPILVELAEALPPPARFTVTLQLEVVKRLLAKPATDDYGLLTLLIALRYEPAAWFRIPPNCFFPQPNVDSACVTLIRRPQPLLSPAEAQVFTRLVKIAFNQRRKMMFKLLTAAWPEARLDAAFSATGIAKTERAEHVDLQGFVALACQLGAAGNSNLSPFC
jgi:16S rRNA (adenine1518-N6/adenine1519-N6)-dimethyltransferase